MAQKKKQKSKGSKGKNLPRKRRLRVAKEWLASYEGEEVAKDYRERFGVDWRCAFIELEMLEVEIAPEYQEEVLKMVEAQAAAKKKRKEENKNKNKDKKKKKKKKKKKQKHDFADEEAYQDDQFAYIAGYTSGGAPFGLSWEEWDIIETIEAQEKRLEARRVRKFNHYVDEEYESQLDANILNLVKALNSFEGVQTFGSCGGHANPKGGQWAEGSWYILFDISKDLDGWYALEFLSWLINNDMAKGSCHVTLYPYAAPPYLNEPGRVLSFALEGRNGESPEELADLLLEIKMECYIPPVYE